MHVKSPKWAKTPRPAIVENLEEFKKGTLLDLGGSDGVNDIYFAEKGFEVTNVDKDAEAISTFLQNADKLNVHGIVSELENYSITQTYDNIITIYTLHFLSQENGTRLLKEIQSNTNAGGTNLIITFTNFGTFKITEEELLEMYKDWEIIKHIKDKVLTRQGPIQERAFLLARKKK